MNTNLWGLVFAIVLSIVIVSMYKYPDKWIDFFNPFPNDDEGEENEL